MTSLLRGTHQKEGFCDRGASGAEVQVLHLCVQSFVRKQFITMAAGTVPWYIVRCLFKKVLIPQSKQL